MTTVPGVSLREMTMADVAAGMSLCRASGWNQTERDWEIFLTTAPDSAIVAERNGSVVGTVAVMPYGSFAWISMVLVDPAARGRGVGTLLLHRGLDLVPAATTARLDATPAGEVLYRKLGFVGEYGLARWFITPRASRQARVSGARRLERADWQAIRVLDLCAFGAPRTTLLERLADDAPEYAWVVERDGLRGYLFGRHGHVREQLGPLIADDGETARALLESCLDAHFDRAFCIDVPDAQETWRKTLSAIGFAIERPFLRMHRGRLDRPGQPARVYAITGPEFG
jgi:predicted N-acetyltransferase YhbS